MAFKTLNKNFIHHELTRPMRDLNSLEKVELYKLIQVETRKRLRESYQHSLANKEQFYLDAFDVLGDYEGEYLIMNLLIESQWFDILKKVLLKAKENRTTFKFPDDLRRLLESIESSTYNRLDLDDAEEKRKALIHVLTFLEDLGENNNSFVKDFFTFTAGSNQIVRFFLSAIVDERRRNDERFWIFLLFNKIWKEYYLDGSLHSVRGAIFYRELSQHVEREDAAIEHTKFIDYVNSKLIDNFAHIEHSTLHLNILDFVDSAQMTKFYLDYQGHISKVREIMKLSDESSFLDILRYVEERKEFDKRTIMLIQNKISQFQYPNSLELGYFKKVYSEYGYMNRCAKRIISSLYLIELI